MSFHIRRAVEADAAGIVAILTGIAAEGVFTAISRPWPVEQQRAYMVSLSPRAAIHVAESEEGALLGYQVLDLWAPTLDSMAHVAQIGTYLRPEHRRQGLGAALFRHTSAFARQQDYQKIVILVRASNTGALAYYQRLGFRECGRLARQVHAGDQFDDEVLLELFLAPR